MPENPNLTSTATTATTASPEKALTIYRHAKHRVYTFSPGITAPAEYTVVKRKPSIYSHWMPLLYRGSSAASPPEIPIVGSVRRSGFWAKLSLELGDGVGQIVQNLDAERMRAIDARKRWWRRLFRMKERPGKEIRDVEVSGLVLAVCMERRPRLERAMRWEFNGTEYVWTGTRRMARSVFKRIKGYSHDMKLTRTCDHALLATYEKKHFACSKGPGMCRKDKKRSIGTLRISSAVYEHPQLVTQDTVGTPRHQVGSNLTGTHTGDIFEEAVVMTCWAAIEAEHKIRHTILEIIIAIGEAAGG